MAIAGKEHEAREIFVRHIHVLAKKVDYGLFVQQSIEVWVGDVPDATVRGEEAFQVFAA